jgi:alkylhydroperoxidase family enzyme
MMPTARLPGVAPERIAALDEISGILAGDFHELPNSIFTLAHRPPILAAALRLWQAVMSEGTVERGLKWMVGNLASKAHGCMYCSAHTVSGAARAGVPDAKVDALWTFEHSAVFSSAEKVALRFALLAGQSPNGVTDSDFAALREHFNDEQCAELLAVVACYGFFNRWNDSLATPLEPTPRALAERHLGGAGWRVGRHRGT